VFTPVLAKHTNSFNLGELMQRGIASEQVKIDEPLGVRSQNELPGIPALCNVVRNMDDKSREPQGALQPLVSTLNAGDGAITSNMAIVPANNGSISAFGSGATHLVLDVSGYFAATTMAPTKDVAVRTSAGKLSAIEGDPGNTPQLAVNAKAPNLVPAQRSSKVKRSKRNPDHTSRTCCGFGCAGSGPRAFCLSR
jgi:hypothetical protein